MVDTIAAPVPATAPPLIFFVRVSPREGRHTAYRRSATSGPSPKLLSPIPVGREGRIEEAADVVVSMCLPHARFMTGQAIHVSGGLYMP